MDGKNLRGNMNKIIFLHIPKTGGTSTHSFLVNQFQESEVFPDRFNTLRNHSKEHLSKYKYFSGHYDMDGIERIPGNKFIFTFLRDPVERVLSLYYFWRSITHTHIEKFNLGGPRVAKRLNLLDFLRYKKDGIPANIDNYMARLLLGGGINCNSSVSAQRVYFDECVESLNRFDFIGFLDSYDDDYKSLLSMLGFEATEHVPYLNKGSDTDLTRETVEKELITEEIQIELDRLTLFDQIVYEWAKGQ